MVTIKEALDQYDLGTLREGHNSAYGKTDKGIQVWLPIVPKTDEWENLVTEINGEKLILQRGLTGSSFQYREPDMITSRVITRDAKTGNANDLGEYQQVLFDKTRCFTVHAKVPPFTSGGISPCGKKLVYDTNYVKTDQEAQERSDELYKKFDGRRAG